MIKLKLKFDVSFSKLALVFVGSAACYGVIQFVSGLVKSASLQNISETPSKGSLSDVLLYDENTQESKAVKRNRTTSGVSRNHRVNNKVVKKNLVTTLLAIKKK